MRNCANYGSITHSGTVYGVFIGGIVGLSEGGNLSTNYIQNCFNYGAINHNGTTTSNLCIGGILGYIYGANNIENCANNGKITTTTISGKNNYIGSAIGYIDSGATSITHCYWTSDVGYDSIYEYKPNSSSATLKKYNTTTTVDNLNSYNSSWNKWLLNTNNWTVTFKSNNDNGFNLSSQLILLPSLAESENHTFSGWFEDEDCTKEFTSSFVEAEIVLYGGWSYTITFDPTGGVATTSKKSVVYGQKYGELPAPQKPGYTSTGWFTEAFDGERITAEDTVSTMSNHTLYAQWVINNYTITFDYVNGTVVNKILKYNETIVYPENPTREGFVFNGWVLKPERMPANDTTVAAQWTINNYTVTFVFGNGTVVNETLTFNETINYPVNLTREGFVFSGWEPRPERMPANDTTVVAQWIEVEAEIESEYVEIVFDRKDMTEEEVKEIIKNITQGENVYIERIETDKDTGETIAVIRFTDAEKAKDFVRGVSEGRALSFIIRVSTVPPEQDSFALKINAMPMTALLILYFMCVAHT